MKPYSEEIDRLLACLLAELEGDLTPKDQLFVQQWRQASSENEALHRELQESGVLRGWLAQYQEFETKSALQRLKAKRHRPENLSDKSEIHSRRRMVLARATAAAAMILIALGVLFWKFGPHDRDQLSTDAGHRSIVDIAPGTHGAILTLADGSEIDLSEQQQGVVIGDLVRYLDGTEVVEARRPDAGGHLSNQLSLKIPRGRTYQITLPDGTKVWLNAASILRYPQAFEPGAERVVELEGEAYFDVTTLYQMNSQRRIPFKISANGQLVEVLGTEFNISAYPDDPQTSTTLVEGSVRVSIPQQEGDMADQVVLRVGQQSTFSHSGDPKIVVSQVDAKAFTEWRSGLIVFSGADIHSVFRQIERWYDVSFEFEQPLPEMHWHGEIPRTIPLSQLLDALSKKTNMKFELKEERRVVVYK